jgi:hypothetical protein
LSSCSEKLPKKLNVSVRESWEIYILLQKNSNFLVRFLKKKLNFNIFIELAIEGNRTVNRIGQNLCSCADCGSSGV